MNALQPRSASTPSLAELHAGFLSILPRIQTHGQVSFRHLKCQHRKADSIQEMIAVSWKWYLRATQQGKDVLSFASALATFAARHGKNGRKLCGQDRGKDALSPLAQHRHGFTTAPLPAGSSLHGNVFDEALKDNTRSPVAEQVAFRLDYPVWLNSLSERDRRVCEDLMLGERTGEVAGRYGLTAGRVSQLRRQFLEGWRRFCNDHTDGTDTGG
jgi:hypothetical protein